jgi:hypothetical protein
MRIPRRTVVIAVGILTVLVAGCGGGGSATSGGGSSGNALTSLTATQILTKAVADLNASSSVHLAGSEQNSGQTYTMDLTIGASGCTGTVGMGAQGTLRLLRIGGTVWIKGDDKFWKSSLASSPGYLHAVEGKYVRLSPKGPATSSFSAFCYLSQIAGQFGSGENRVVKGQTTTILGQPALQLKDTQQSGTAYVTLSADPEFLRTGDTSGHVDFTNYNAPLTLSPPPAGETVAGARYGL